MSVETIESVAESVIADSREYLYPAVAPYYKEPLVIAEASGVNVIDADGREYLDLFAGILTTSVGHCNPEVVERVRDQVGRLGHTSSLYYNENQTNVAKRLASIAPGKLKRTFFTNSGTEAIETALLSARLFTGRNEIIALRHGYSGRSTMATNLTGHAAWRMLPAQVAGVTHAMSPYSYRCPFKSPCDESCSEKFARDLEELIQTTTSGAPAALLIETIQGVGGYIVPPPGYFQRVVEVIHKYGGLFICDEVQTGFGRTGNKWFGIEHWGVEPDIMVMAKGVANGFPVGVTITRDEIAAAWTGKTISTFGGNPICMAAADTTLEIMAREDVPSRAAARGAQLRAGLDELSDSHGWIGEVRGMGLMQAIEVVEDRTSKKPDRARAVALLEAARAEGVLIGLGGLYGNVIRIGPSLLITEAEIADGVERLARACALI